MSSRKWLLIGLVLIASCGGSSPSSVEGKIDLGVDWKSSESGISLSKYAEFISARASVASLEPVETAAEDGIYHFELGEVEGGQSPLLLEFIYSGSVIAKIETVVEFNDEPLELFLSPDEVSPADPDRSIAELIMSVAALPVSDADGDGVSDADEFVFGTSPLRADTEGDGLADGAELSYGCDPKNSDTDGDGFGDSEDKFPLDEFENADADGDGVGDNSDNCKMAPNSSQRDADKDGYGDECSNDDDGDGLSDADEIINGCNPKNPDTDFDGLSDSYEVQKGLNPLLADSDSDETVDAVDLFPLDASEAFDADLDGVGDNGDNCPAIANADQKNTDAKYFSAGVKLPNGGDVEADALGDSCDSDFDGDGEETIFVSISSASSEEIGSFCEPFRSLSDAVERAALFGDAIKVAAGSYDVRDVDFSKVSKIFGGYSNNFAQRKVMNSISGFKTEFINSTSPVVVALTNAESSLSLDGLFFKGGGVQDSTGGVLPDSGVFFCANSPLFVSGGNLSVKNSIIEGSLESNSSCGAAAYDGANLNFENVVVKGQGAANALRSAALVSQNAAVVVANSVLSAGNGKYSTGIATDESQISLSNSVVDGSSKSPQPKSSIALKFSGGSLNLNSNKLFTASASEQIVLLCGGASVKSGSLKNNTLTTFPASGSNSVLFDCNGSFVTTESFNKNQALLCSLGIECAANKPYGGTLDDLFEDVYDIL